MAVETISIYEAERDKYCRIWAVPEYRNVSFGEELLGAFLTLTGAKPGQSVVDVGCGTGRVSLKLAQLLMDVTMLDVSLDVLDPEVYKAMDSGLVLRFSETCLWSNWGFGQCDFAYCCDVLEHIPTEFTMLVAANCIRWADRSVFHINFDPDFFGSQIGETLHLTVRPFTWWRDRLAEIGKLVEARDMLGRGLFVVDRS